MSRRSRIRWRESDEKELARLVKNYNAKLSRIIKKDPNMKDYLPERVSKRDIKKDIVARSDLKKEMHSLERFLKRGSEEIVYNNLQGEDRFGITKYEKREIEIKVATINRLKSIRRKELEELEVTSRGKNVGYKNKEMGRMETLQMLQPKVFNFKTKKKRDFQHFVKGLEKADVYIDMKDKILKDNYVDSLYEHLGNNKYTQMIADKIENMNMDKFISKYYSDKEAVIEFIYDPIQATHKIEELLKVWEIDDNAEIVDTEGIVDNPFSSGYTIYDKDGRKLKVLGTKRATERFMQDNPDAVEFKYEMIKQKKKRK